LHEGFFSPNGEWLVYRVGSVSNASNPDIFALRVGVDSLGTPLLATEYAEWSPALSPDGQWLAYASNETGRNEVHARPFPDVESGKWPLDGFLLGISYPLVDVSRDDQRFVMLRMVSSTDTGRLILVQNFFEELKDRVGG
jgi:hypothetical protein